MHVSGNAMRPHQLYRRVESILVATRDLSACLAVDIRTSSISFPATLIVAGVHPWSETQVMRVMEYPPPLPYTHIPLTTSPRPKIVFAAYAAATAVPFSDPALSGCSAAVEQALMAWDFLSCSRDLVGLVLPPAKRMIDALTPPTGKVGSGWYGEQARALNRFCVQ